MRNLMGRSLAGGLVLGVVLAACSLASATNLDDLRIGETWWGDSLKNADLQGKVTLVEFWGAH